MVATSAIALAFFEVKGTAPSINRLIASISLLVSAR